MFWIAYNLVSWIFFFIQIFKLPLSLVMLMQWKIPCELIASCWWLLSNRCFMRKLCVFVFVLGPFQILHFIRPIITNGPSHKKIHTYRKQLPPNRIFLNTIWWMLLLLLLMQRPFEVQVAVHDERKKILHVMKQPFPNGAGRIKLKTSFAWICYCCEHSPIILTQFFLKLQRFYSAFQAIDCNWTSIPKKYSTSKHFQAKTFHRCRFII